MARPSEPSARPWLVVVVGLLLVVACVGAARGPLVHTQRAKVPVRVVIPQLHPAGSASPAPRLPVPQVSAKPEAAAHAPSTGPRLNLIPVVLLGELAGVLVFTGAVWMLRRWARRRWNRTVVEIPPSPEAGSADELATLTYGVARAVDELEASGSPRDRVIACWRRLEDAVAASAAPRVATETAGDLVRRVLSTRHGVDPNALDHLRAGYDLARFSRREIGSDLVAEARGDLQRVVATLNAARQRTEAT